MNTPNLYWSVYKNLEHELKTLTRYVHISDDQLKTYSVHIADLLVRCVVEIESLSKELYSLNGGDMTPTDERGNTRNLYFGTDCLEYLEQLWKLSKKQITISGIGFYLRDEKNYVVTPLYKANKRGTSGSKWKQAYQALKHNRSQSLKKATIENYINALGALFILNKYYADSRTDIGRVYLSDHVFDNRAGSDVFSADYCTATGLEMSQHMDDSSIFTNIGDKLDKAIFVVKYDDNSFAEMHKNYCLDYEITVKRFEQSKEISDFLASNPDYMEKSINEICMAAGGVSLLQRIICNDHTMQEKNTRLEAVINKHMPIYPELFPLTS